MHSQTESDTPQFPLDDDCFAIRQAARYISQLYDRHLGHTGLKITQFSIMTRLLGGRRMTMKALAEAMVMERTTLVRAIQPLQRDGLLHSIASAADPRALTVALTAAGEDKWQSALQCWYAAQKEFEERVGPERAASLRRELFDLTGKKTL